MVKETITMIFPTLKENKDYIYDALFDTGDLKTQEITWNDKSGMIVYLETMVDMEHFEKVYFPALTKTNEGQQLEDLTVSPDVMKINQLNKVVSNLLKGYCALFLEEQTACFLFNSKQVNSRSPDEPENEKTVRGAHKGFIENLDINLNLIRERIQNRQLTIKYFKLGTESNSIVAMIYMNDIANPLTVGKVQERIESISSDMIFSPGYIEEIIEDTPFSPFQQVLFTERPDRVEANLIEGRIVIMSEGSSDASIVPVTFFSFFQSPDDYNIRFFAGSFFRLLRLLCFWGSLTLPAIYIAVVAFHFEIIPYDMVEIVKGSIQNIPFSPFVEALIMAVTIELIREAGIRLPTPIGQTIGIVGGLIIGESVVNAGLVSNIMVIVIALTAIMSFCIPSYEMGNTVRLLSLPVMLGAATLGFVGIVFTFMLIVIHLCTLQSFGTPYLSPLTPFNFREFKDAFIRVPSWMMDYRPEDLHTKKQSKHRDFREWDKHDWEK